MSPAVVEGNNQGVAIVTATTKQDKTQSGSGVKSSLFLILGAVIIGALSYFSLLLIKSDIDPFDYQGRLKDILSTTPLVDGHNDLPYLLRIELQNKIYHSEDFNFWDGTSIFLTPDTLGY